MGGFYWQNAVIQSDTYYKMWQLLLLTPYPEPKPVDYMQWRKVRVYLKKTILKLHSS